MLRPSADGAVCASLSRRLCLPRASLRRTRCARCVPRRPRGCGSQRRRAGRAVLALAPRPPRHAAPPPRCCLAAHTSRALRCCRGAAVRVPRPAPRAARRCLLRRPLAARSLQRWLALASTTPRSTRASSWCARAAAAMRFGRAAWQALQSRGADPPRLSLCPPRRRLPSRTGRTRRNGATRGCAWRASLRCRSAPQARDTARLAPLCLALTHPCSHHRHLGGLQLLGPRLLQRNLRKGAFAAPKAAKAHS